MSAGIRRVATVVTLRSQMMMQVRGLAYPHSCIPRNDGLILLACMSTEGLRVDPEYVGLGRCRACRP